MVNGKMTPNRINMVRGWVTWAVRCVALILVVTGLYLVLKRFTLGLGDNFNFNLIFRTYEGTGEGQSMYRGIAMALVGLPLGFWSRKIAAWVIAMPPTGCPQCGYAVAPPDGGVWPAKCPECGLRLEK